MISSATILAMLACPITEARTPGLESKPDDSLNACNVIWDSPSKDSRGSMPLGNGDVGVNAWVEENGDLLFFISKTDAWTDCGRLVKLGRVRVRLDPPLAVTNGFRQELRLCDGSIVIESSIRDSQSSIRLWVDANRPVIHVEGESQHDMQARVSLHVWRTKDRDFQQDNSAAGVIRGGVPIIEKADLVLPPKDNRIVWRHRNELTIYPPTMMLDCYDGTQDKAFLRETLLPVAAGVATFFDQHWKRGGKGKIRFEPACSLEACHEVVHPLPEIAGLKYILPRLLALPADATTAAQRAAWAKTLADLPEIPLGGEEGKKIYLFPAWPKDGDVNFKLHALENTPEYEITRNYLGIVTKALKKGAIGGARMCMDQYLEFPVMGRLPHVHGAEARTAGREFPGAAGAGKAMTRKGGNRL